MSYNSIGTQVHLLFTNLNPLLLQPVPAVDIDEQTQLQIAMSLSKEEAHKVLQSQESLLHLRFIH